VRGDHGDLAPQAEPDGRPLQQPPHPRLTHPTRPPVDASTQCANARSPGVRARQRANSDPRTRRATRATGRCVDRCANARALGVRARAGGRPARG
jgi:hypothetical protein